jgi:hypothetical protein
MFNSVRKHIAIWNKNRWIKSAKKGGKDGNYWSAHMLQNDKKVKKFIPQFEHLGDRYYELLWENSDKVDIEHQFARLMILKQTELYQGIMLLSFFEFSHAIIPLMRNFCDTVLFLKYVEIHPDYIKRFMQKQGQGVSMYQIKNEIADEELKIYYSYLSELMHSNPTSIKLTYYCIGTGAKMMAHKPLNMDDFRYAYIRSLFNFMEESIRIIEIVYSTQWKPDRKT